MHIAQRSATKPIIADQFQLYMPFDLHLSHYMHRMVECVLTEIIVIHESPQFSVQLQENNNIIVRYVGVDGLRVIYIYNNAQY